MQGLAHWRTPDRNAVQKLPALIGNPRSSQQLMGQLVWPRRRKSSIISRARAWAYVLGLRDGGDGATGQLRPHAG